MKKLNETAEGATFAPKAASYFTSDREDLEFIHTGCTLLDCLLGGGYVLGRITNIVGDKSTGKTLLAMEGAANFLQQYPNGRVFYRESESAFDPHYARALGIPVDRIDMGVEIFTVEDMFEDITKQIEYCNENEIPGLYIIDSLDALSDRAELDRDIDKGSFGAAKAKLMSSLFRQRVQQLSKSRMCWLVVSQVRDNIGVMFGPKHTRSGGRALDFYSSHIIYLSQIKQITQTKSKVERVTGIRIQAYSQKNKITFPLRKVVFDIIFGYGVDDEISSLDWLVSVGKYDKDEAKGFLTNREEKSKHISQDVVQTWREIEEKFLPPRRKYNGSSSSVA